MIKKILIGLLVSVEMALANDVNVTGTLINCPPGYIFGPTPGTCIKLAVGNNALAVFILVVVLAGLYIKNRKILA